MALFRCCSLRFIFILCMLQLLQANCDDESISNVDDIIIEFINGTYIDEDTFDISVNYNEDGNTISIKIDVINELPPHIFLKMKVLGRALGQYKVPTGISMDVDICDGKFKRYLLDNILSSIGVNMKDCPPTPGSYGVEDFKASIDGLPTYALAGLNILIEIEVHSPPDISIMKLKSYNRV